MKTIIKYIISIILAIAIVVYILLQMASSTVLEKDYVLKKMEETNYFDKIYEIAKSNLENYTYQSGLDETFLDEIISKEKVEEDTKTILNNIYDGTNVIAGREDFEKNIEQHIKEKMKGQIVTSKQQQAINALKDTMYTEYAHTIIHFSSYESGFHETYQRIAKYCYLAKNVTIATIIVSIIILIILSIKKIYCVFSNIGTALIISGLIYSTGNIFLRKNIVIKNIFMFNEAFSDILRNTVIEILSYINKYSLIMCILGIGLIFISNLLQNMRKSNEKA